MKVKCIWASQSDDYLVVGQVYEVEKESPIHYYLVGIPYSWSKYRFEDCEADLRQHPTPTVKKYSTQCPCGIVATDCTYHH